MFEFLGAVIQHLICRIETSELNHSSAGGIVRQRNIDLQPIRERG